MQNDRRIREPEMEGMAADSWKHRLPPAGWIVAGLLVLATATGAQTAGTFQHDDPIGDNFGNGNVQHDLKRVTAFADDQALRIFLEFVESVTAGDSGRNDAIYGALDLDTDLDPTTGVEPLDAALGGSSGLGVDHWIPLNLISNQSSDVPLLDATDNTIVGNASAEVLFDQNEIVLTIPLDLLGSGHDGEVDLSVVASTFEEATDIAPNAGKITSLPNDEREFQGQFRVSATWKNFQGVTGNGRWVTSNFDSGVIWFFEPDNWEVLVKVLDGCSINGHFWVFFAATTNVEFEITVEDLATGVVRTYENALGQSADAVTDSLAFPTCGGQI